jgi:hypothetical protein
MKWLPYESFYIDTNLDPTTAEADLEAEVGPDLEFSYYSAFRQRYDGCFFGSIANGSFRFRQINYRNPFLPMITGTIEPRSGGSRASVQMKMHIVAIILVCTWLGATGLATMIFLLFRPNEDFLAYAEVFFLMFLFGYIITLVGFRFEAPRAKKTLASILQGSIIEA